MISKIFFNRIAACAAIIAGLFAAPAYADYTLGQKYYEQSQFDKAYQEFWQAAQYGDAAAQFALGVMYYEGQFVQKDPLKAYAWVALAAQDNDYKEKDLHTQIYNEFSAEDKKKADRIYQEIFDEYGEAALAKKLAPVYTGASPPLSTQMRILKQVSPQYPANMEQDYKSGWVDMIYTVDKDGTTRDHVVYYSSDQAFTDAVIRVVRGWQYEPMTINGKAVAVNGLKMRFVFSLGERFDKEQIDQILADLRKKAESGDASAKYHYAYFLDALPSYTKYKPSSNQDNPNKWYLAAASSGSAISSFFLGSKILNGDMCTADESKSMAWLLKAASKDVVDAQYLLALELFSGARLGKNVEQARYWLQRAASASASGSPAAKLRYAEMLATDPDDTRRNGKLAASYLAQVNKNYHDKQTYYQVAAAVAAENGDFAEAVNWEKKAQADASWLKLPLERINARLDAYSQKQAWRE